MQKSPILMLLLILMSLTFCGTEPERSESAIETNETISIPIGINTISDLGLIGAVDAFSISVDSCASGLTVSASESDASMNVYEGDRGCLAKLTQFQIGATTYTPSVGDPFTTWLANDEAIFEGGGNSLIVAVVNTLATPLTTSDTVLYEVYTADGGADSTALSITIGTMNTITHGGNPVPAFTGISVEMVDVVPSPTEAGVFKIQLECDTDMTSTWDTCSSIDLDNLTYKLIDNTYGASITKAQANSHFPSGESTVTVARKISPTGSFNGGFYTDDLDGPNDMHINPEMMFLLRGNGTYLYFTIDVTLVE